MRIRLSILAFFLGIIGCGKVGPYIPYKPPHLDPKKDELMSERSKAAAVPSEKEQFETEDCKWVPGKGYVSGPTIIESVTTAEGVNEALGGGCIDKSIQAVWSQTQTAAALVWDRSDQTSFASQTPTEGAVFNFTTSYEAGPVIFKQKWGMRWVHWLERGTMDRPETVRIDYIREWDEGPGKINPWEGWFELVFLNEETTSFRMKNRLKATSTGKKESEDTIRRMLKNLR
jgi:hypothetical protein